MNHLAIDFARFDFKRIKPRESVFRTEGSERWKKEKLSYSFIQQTFLEHFVC